MKTLKKGDEIVRKSDEDAEAMVNSGWSYCKKTEWKKSVRDKGKKVVKTEPKVKEDNRPSSKYRDKKRASEVADNNA